LQHIWHGNRRVQPGRRMSCHGVQSKKLTGSRESTIVEMTKPAYISVFAAFVCFQLFGSSVSPGGADPDIGKPPASATGTVSSPQSQAAGWPGQNGWVAKRQDASPFAYEFELNEALAYQHAIVSRPVQLAPGHKRSGHTATISPQNP